MADELTIEGRYQVVFTGLLVKGADLSRVRKNFREQFKLSEEKLGKLFSGQNIAIRKDISWQDAIRYRDYMKELGALCEVLPLEDSDSGEEHTDSFPCPKCRNLASGNRCVSCGFDIGNYRMQMMVKGLVELPGALYIKERRQEERRKGEDRRDGVRFEDGRRVGKDRRKYKTGWEES